MGGDEENPELTEEQKQEKEQPTRYNYGIIVQSDIPDDAKKKEILDFCQIACEKFAAAEKSLSERDNMAVAETIKKTLDAKMNGPFNVVVGECFGLEIDFIQKTHMFMYFGGYLGICLWKCV